MIIATFYIIALSLRLTYRAGVAAEPIAIPATITPPPLIAPTSFGELVRRRDSSTTCSFGICGSTCLAQGAFCWNPGGTTANVPNCRIIGSTLDPDECAR